MLESLNHEQAEYANSSHYYDPQDITMIHRTKTNTIGVSNLTKVGTKICADFSADGLVIFSNSINLHEVRYRNVHGTFDSQRAPVSGLPDNHSTFDALDLDHRAHSSPHKHFQTLSIDECCGA